MRAKVPLVASRFGQLAKKAKIVPTLTSAFRSLAVVDGRDSFANARFK